MTALLPWGAGRSEAMQRRGASALLILYVACAIGTANAVAVRGPPDWCLDQRAVASRRALFHGSSATGC